MSSSPLSLHGQTQWKDNYVTLAANDQTDPTIARPSNTEYTVIVWEDARDGGTDIYSIAGDTLSFIVWEDQFEYCPSSSRTKEVAGQWVLYNSYHQLLTRGAQWSTPKPISPGGGYYTQIQPRILTSADSTVSVYWIDGRGLTDLAMGTRVRAEGSDAIFWSKRPVAESKMQPAAFKLGETWPNPVSLAYGGISHIVVDMNETEHVRLTLHDNLGRFVTTVHDGTLVEGQNILRFDASRLRTGVYYYVLTGSRTSVSRGLVIVK